MTELPEELSRKEMINLVLEANDEISVLIKAIDHPLRLQLLALLAEDKRSFSELVSYSNSLKSQVGNHLSIMVDAGIVDKKDRGLYKINDDGETLLSAIAQTFLEMKIREQQRLDRLKIIIKRFTPKVDQLDDLDRSQIKMNGTEKISKREEIDVRIVQLQGFTYASVRVFGKSPEVDAFSKMQRWAEEKGVWGNLVKHPLYGFNNPDPDTSEEEPEYGYEVWIVVDDTHRSDEVVEVRKFPGGLYAVTTTYILPLDERGVIPSWPTLVDWVKDSEYEMSSHQWLEKALTPNAELKDAMLDLYLPIAVKE